MAATGSQDGASSSNKQSTPVYHSADVTGKQGLKCLIFQ